MVEEWQIPNVDRTHVKTGRLGGPDHQQTEVRGHQNGQVVLPAFRRYRRIGQCRSTVMCCGCIRHTVQGCQNYGSKGTTGVGKEEEEERTNS